MVHKEVIRNDFLKEKVEFLEPLLQRIGKLSSIGLLGYKPKNSSTVIT